MFMQIEQEFDKATHLEHAKFGGRSGPRNKHTHMGISDTIYAHNTHLHT